MTKTSAPLNPVFFAAPAEFEAWLSEHHETESELVVGYYKVATGRPTMTWPESVDEALCFGWIDGIRRRIDDEAYSIRFTPRRPNSIWSAVNLGRVAVLKKEGRMRPTGLAAYERRTEARSVVYAYEHTADKPTELDPQYADQMAKIRRLRSSSKHSHRDIASAQSSGSRARRRLKRENEDCRS